MYSLRNFLALRIIEFLDFFNLIHFVEPEKKEIRCNVNFHWLIKCSEGEINKIGIKMDEQIECVVKQELKKSAEEESVWNVLSNKSSKERRGG